MINYFGKKNSGQVVIISTILIGGAILAATAISGFTLFLEIRQLNDSVQSSKAIYAADAGIEDSLYCYYTKPLSEEASTYCSRADIAVETGVTYTTTLSCYTDSAGNSATTACNAVDADGFPIAKSFSIDSTGHTSRVDRSLRTFYEL
ncbi:MAG: hypothetical protein WCO21_02340 [bacterium]